MAPPAPWVLQSLLREAAIGTFLGFCAGMVWYYTATKPTAARMVEYYKDDK